MNIENARGYWWDGSDEPLTLENLPENARKVFGQRPEDLAASCFCPCCSEIEPQMGHGVRACTRCYEGLADFALRILAGVAP